MQLTKVKKFLFVRDKSQLFSLCSGNTIISQLTEDPTKTLVLPEINHIIYTNNHSLLHEFGHMIIHIACMNHPTHGNWYSINLAIDYIFKQAVEIAAWMIGMRLSKKEFSSRHIKHVLKCLRSYSIRKQTALECFKDFNHFEMTKNGIVELLEAIQKRLTLN